MVNQMWDHVEKVHCQELAAFATDEKYCPIYKEKGVVFTPSTIAYFKHYCEGTNRLRDSFKGKEIISIES